MTEDELNFFRGLFYGSLIGLSLWAALSFIQDSMNDYEALKAQNAALREALVKVDKEKDGLSFTCANAVIQALSLTPSDAADMARKKEGV